MKRDEGLSVHARLVTKLFWERIALLTRIYFIPILLTVTYPIFLSWGKSEMRI